MIEPVAAITEGEVKFSLAINCTEEI